MAKLTSEDEVAEAAPTGDDDKLTAALVDDEPDAEAETAPAEEVAEAPAEETPTETTEEPAAEVAEAPTEEAVPAAEPTPETPAEVPTPGTPNKALQAAQQNQAALERKLDALTAMIQQQGKATPEQAQQVATIQAKAVEVADEVSGLLAEGREFDPFTDTKPVIKRVIGQDSRITALEARLQQAEARAVQAEESARWTSVESQYPGVDVRAKWAEAVEQAKAEGFTADLTTRANFIFHESAKASVAKPAELVPAKPAIAVPPKAKTPAPTARKAPPTTPGGAGVTPKTGVVSRPAQVSEEAQTEALAKALWR